MGQVKSTALNIKDCEKIENEQNICETSEIETKLEKVPYVIRWVYGGKDIFVLGDFNSWQKLEEYKLFRSGHEHITIVELSRKVHFFKFIVDGEWRYSYNIPYKLNKKGEINNFIDLRNYKSPIYSIQNELQRTKFQKFHQGFPFDFPADAPALPILLGKTKCLVETENKVHFPFHCINNHIYYDSFIQEIFGDNIVTFFVTKKLNSYTNKLYRTKHLQKHTSIMYATIRRSNKDFYPISIRKKNEIDKYSLPDLRYYSGEENILDPYFKLRIRTTTELFASMFRL
ncbi:AMP-activated protein kinase beta chain [Cryptosporidium ryanae]|uniref:AMP-activated protein kinase beta chain n=1 Tax=Cryptosporidium ryanae TaxID=515981 RepID=UPI00351A6FA1|nr:AMP-activated protein kinase beta chain [Cryptosporidium ryanae]